jgi:hypothetical protein
LTQNISVGHNLLVQEVRITRSARKHRVGNAHIIEAMVDAGERYRMTSVTASRLFTRCPLNTGSE